MKNFVVLAAVLFISGACNPQDVEKAGDKKMPSGAKTKIIFDTDIAADCDDAGAMAVLHALADNGELEILGMMVSMPVEYGAPALDAINTFYNRPHVPVGTLKKPSVENPASLKIYNRDLALRFPNDLKHAANAPDAIVLYRRLLSKALDNSITIVTTGPLTNLHHLMISKADSISALSGMELIRKKVRLLVTAGGRLPGGSSYNFYISPEDTEYVINGWPTEYWFVPNQLGDSVLTGTRLIAETTLENPVRMAYTLYRAAHPQEKFRPSWDQMGVLIAARGKGGLFKANSTGRVLARKHKIEWQSSPDKNHVWYQNDSSPEARRKVIEDLMVQRPKKGS